LGLPITEEINPNVSNHPECRVQAYERGVVAYDPAHALDGPPAAGSVYVLHIESSPQYLAITGKLTALQNAYNSVVSEKNGLIALREQNATTITQLNQQITTLQQQLANDNEATIQKLQQQVNDLTAHNTQLTSQIAGFTDKLTQIETLAKVS
jgi:cell division protein FtsB